MISKRGEGVLARVGGVLAAMDDKQIQVSGHTDSNPISEKLASQFPTNWELSVSRAINVVRFLEEKANVPAKNLIASGYGQHHPIASNKSAAGRARNRRIEILLTPSLAPKAIAKSKLKEAEAEAAQAQADKPAKATQPAKTTQLVKADKPRQGEQAQGSGGPQQGQQEPAEARPVIRAPDPSPNPLPASRGEGTGSASRGEGTGQAGAASGRSTKNDAPSPTWLRTPMVPPCASTITRAIQSPRPKPA